MSEWVCAQLPTLGKIKLLLCSWLVLIWQMLQILNHSSLLGLVYLKAKNGVHLPPAIGETLPPGKPQYLLVWSHHGATAGRAQPGSLPATCTPPPNRRWSRWAPAAAGMLLRPFVHFEDAAPRPAGTDAASAGATATASAGATATVQVPPTLPAPGSPPLLLLPLRHWNYHPISAGGGWRGQARGPGAFWHCWLHPQSVWGRWGTDWETGHQGALRIPLSSKGSFARKRLGISWGRTSSLMQTES